MYPQVKTQERDRKWRVNFPLSWQGWQQLRRGLQCKDQVPLCPDGHVQPQQPQLLRIMCRRSKMMLREEREEGAESLISIVLISLGGNGTRLALHSCRRAQPHVSVSAVSCHAQQLHFTFPPWELGGWCGHHVSAAPASPSIL